MATTQTEMKPDEIFNYLKSSGEAMASSRKAQIDIARELDNQEAAMSAAMVARTAMGDDEATIIAAKHTRQAALDLTNANIRLAFGADTTKQGSESNFWLQEMQANSHKAYAALDEIKAKQSLTILDDPLGFISAQFTLPADIATHNYYAEKHNIAEQELDNITNSSNSAVIANTNAAAKTSQEEAIAESDKAVQSAIFDNAKIKEATAGNRIRGIGELNNLSAQQASLVLQVHQAQNSDKSLAMQAENQKMAREERTARIAKMKEEELGDKAMMDAYNAGQRNLKKPTIGSLSEWKITYRNQQGRPEFQHTLAMGQDIQAQGGVTDGVSVAGTAGEAALLYASGSTGGNKISPVAMFLTDRLTEVKSLPNAPKDRVALAGEVTTKAQDIAKAQLKQIRDGSPNIYAAPPPAVVLKAIGAASDPFLETMIKPLVDKDPTIKLPDEKIFGSAFEFAGKGKGNLNMAAAGIKAYYDQAVLKNTALNQYVENGLPPQTKYNVNIRGQIIDATNIIEIKAALVRDMVGTLTGDTSTSLFRMQEQRKN